ncbi:3-carboxyethylcatechol 2,3-dioxygenase [Microbacterium thalassium]|uniref:2,3-dihydroxyphenylpropionate/2,3-dihydroxicinnamic acid 1,2-dioxygenase n=1 Tax=Microbacterium thalassium TaxID=362649 RepID=A0A7X0FLR9_9MICO|nr:3-carboxyethylcatechol 2,3-dioxygenase [Microbacterium thalassium]MBB6389811.1 2,3-dihydroxyphenylpropionate 1,2-dioxygenase [Microbacterium thalassium]GLK24499.1 2,3-dihydroxyphenylpropionate/2,3-dihydroxicinnam ic acid 1,2-dioxygenase [Microbacterium thalassium]
MPQALICMSHSPLLEHTDPPADVKAAVEAAFDQARQFARDFRPDIIVNFGPDHYNGFFYDLMPPFCIGYDALGTGDYDSWEGPIPVPTETSERLAQFVIDHDIDTAISRRMEVDHGAVQPAEILFGGLDEVPMIPIFINSVARPFTKVSRIRQFGTAVGKFFADSDKRVLFLGSGGLSHDPPVPQYATATPEQRDFLTDGRHPTPEARAERQQRTIDTAVAFAKGEADIMELNPEWDLQFLEVCRSGDLERFDAYTADEMDALAGHSSHEVRTWVAAYSALRACGPYEVTYEFYRPIKEYIAGFAVTTAVLT